MNQLKNGARKTAKGTSKIILLQIILFTLFASFISYADNRKCYEPKNPDWFVDEVMHKNTLHMVMQTMDDNNIKTDIVWVNKLANTLVRQSDEYINYSKKNKGIEAWETVIKGTKTCGVPDIVYRKGLDKVMLQKLNKTTNVLHD
jgi:hypothetical protein